MDNQVTKGGFEKLLEIDFVTCYDVEKGKPEKRPTLLVLANVLHQPSLVQVVAAIFFSP